ncbi:MAG TPA: DMT family transporter [Candidatus Limnocylindrales bacterium]|nr:DMT family transporter [Candidatus Limnocylindrales bacterium]
MAALLVVVCWGGNFVAVKALVDAIPPIGVSLIRFGLGGLILLAALRWREGSVGLPRRDALAMAVLGGLGFGIYQILWATALRTTTAGDSALLVAATPILTLLMAVLAGTDRLSPGRALGSLIAFAGVALVATRGATASAGGDLLGPAMTLAAALLWAVYVAFGADVLRRHSPLRTTTWAILFGSLCMLPFGLWELASQPVHLDPVIVGALAYSTLLAVALANVAFLLAVKAIGPTRVTAYQFLTPLVAVVLAALFLAEPITAAQVAGGLVIVAGILVARQSRPWRIRTGPRSA